MSVVVPRSIVVVPHLKSHLMTTTALTPTDHKGGIMAVIGIVAAIAIPWAAPIIAQAIGLSGVVGATIGSALVGAGLGAATAAVTGGNVLMGAIGGGLGGGIAGFNAPVPGGPAGSTTGGLGPGGGGGNIAGQLGTTQAVPGASGLVAESADAFNIGTAGEFGTGGSFSGGGSPTLSNGGTGYANTPGDVLSGGANYTNNIGQYSGDVSDLGFGGAGAPSNQISTAGFNSPGANGLRSPQYNPSSGSATLNRWGTQLGRTADQLGSKLGSASDKLFTSENFQQLGGKVATKAFSRAFVGDEPDMSAEERAAMQRRDAAAAQQQAQFEQRRGVSNSYVQQAANINPEYYGQRRLTEEQNRLQRAQQAGLRRTNPSNTGSRSAQQRRNALDTSRLSGFNSGRQEAEAKRLQYMQAAQSAAPTGAGIVSGARADLANADKRYSRLGKAGQEATELFQPIADEIFGVTKKKKLEEANA